MKTQTLFEEDVLLEDVLERNIVVFNDDYNTFEHVIETFVRILDHTPEQAEQCAWLIHHKGKCKVKSGSYEELEPKCTAILETGISAEIH
jgi:ATP-dependent Clp protease adaptor protein ClpS